MTYVLLTAHEKSPAGMLTTSRGVLAETFRHRLIPLVQI